MDTSRVPTDWPVVDAGVLALMHGSLLFGGEPGSGKSFRADLLAAPPVQTDSDGSNGPEVGAFRTEVGD